MKIVKLFSALLIITCILTLTSCTPFDKDYGNSVGLTSSTSIYKDIKIPEIKSDDEQMPTYFDISLYNEINFSEIYLGKKYEFKITYAGSELKLPSGISKMENSGWQLVETNGVSREIQIMAGKSYKANFVNEYGKQITAKFHNDSKSTRELGNCDIVSFIVPENVYLNKDSVYGQFFINGVSNESAITDVIEYLGAPSHFYAVNENEYYLDYFLTPKDKRNGIRVFIDIPSDSVTAIEFSKY